MSVGWIQIMVFTMANWENLSKQIKKNFLFVL